MIIVVCVTDDVDFLIFFILFSPCCMVMWVDCVGWAEHCLFKQAAVSLFH